MASLNMITQVIITLSTQGVARAPFGVMCIAGAAVFDGRTRIFNDATASDADDTLSPKVKAMVRRAFAQPSRPSFVKVGRVGVSTVEVKCVPAVIVEGDTFKVIVGAEEVSVTGKTTAQTVYTDLATAINAKNAWPFTAAGSADKLTLTYKGDKLGGFKLSTNLTQGAWTTNEQYDTALTATELLDPTFYGVVIDSEAEADVIKVADWCESRVRLFGCQSADAKIPNQTATDDLFSKLTAKNLFRTFGVFTKTVSEYPQVAWMAEMLTRCANPLNGWPTWALKKLSCGVDTLAPTETDTVFKKNGNTFERYTSEFQLASEGLALTNKGKVFANEWIDVVVARDYAIDRIRGDQVAVMINRDVTPYTDGGITIMEATLQGSLRYLRDFMGIVAPDSYDGEGKIIYGFTTSAPKRYQVALSDVASRKLGLTFDAVLAGAIQMTSIRGDFNYGGVQ